MITLRMLAIASALLVGLPVGFVLADHAIGHVQTPGGEVVNYGLEAAATVTDITLLEPPARYDRYEALNAPEQLVEGHTVFVTWDIQLVKNVTNWTMDIVGNVDCQDHVNASGEYWGPVLWPTRVDEAHVECEAFGQVFVTPDPFVDSQRSEATPLTPTGEYVPYTTPAGETGYATEHVYEVTSTDWLGQTTTTTYYAWSVPIMQPWMHEDGKPRSWYCPLPVDRLQEMGVSSFTARFVSGFESAP